MTQPIPILRFTIYRFNSVSNRPRLIKEALQGPLALLEICGWHIRKMDSHIAITNTKLYTNYHDYAAHKWQHRLAWHQPAEIILTKGIFRYLELA